jgi:dipeptidyl aminopeptidase/acylaminoacyl peptidase
MSVKSWLATLVALLSFAAADCAAPLEAYGNLPTLSDVTLSPDGLTLAYVKGNETRRLVFVKTLATLQLQGAIDIGDHKLRALQWADNDHLLITISTTTLPRGLIGHRGEFATAEWLELSTKSQHAFLENIKRGGGGVLDVDTMNVIAGVPQPRVIDGHTFVFVRGIYFPGDESRFALFRVDMTNGDTRMVSDPHEIHAEDWVIDNAGNIVAEEDYYERDKLWKMKLYRDGEAADEIEVPAPIEGPDVEGLSEDGAALVISMPQPDGGIVYQQISLKDGSSSAWQHAGQSLGDLMDDIRTGRLIGGSRLTDKTDYVFFDPHTEMVWSSIKTAFQDATNVELVSWSADWNKVVVLAFGPAYGDAYYLIDMTTHKAKPVGLAYEGITDVSPEKWIDYKAADGRVIQAYLTLPLNREPKNLPLIVLPHGGPFDRDDPGFDWLSQALASRGYVVLQPQFRGSDGFGYDLLSAGFGEFGRKMQTDLSDGVRALAAQGLIDPKRVCIVGASYGGYAALAGATLDTGVYRCAVSIAGVSDLQALLSYWHWPRDSLDDRSERFWVQFLGVSDIDDPKLDAISPIKHVDKVTIPILLIHGRDDTVVPFSQSDDMADALTDAKKQVEFVKLDGEDHWLSRSATRLQMIEATVKFLETNNPPN